MLVHKILIDLKFEKDDIIIIQDFMNILNDIVNDDDINQNLNENKKKKKKQKEI